MRKPTPVADWIESFVAQGKSIPAGEYQIERTIVVPADKPLTWIGADQ